MRLWNRARLHATLRLLSLPSFRALELVPTRKRVHSMRPFANLVLCIAALGCGSESRPESNSDATTDVGAEAETSLVPCKTDNDCEYNGVTYPTCQQGHCCNGTFKDGVCTCGSAPGCDRG